jgi:hypothetical protein
MKKMNSSKLTFLLPMLLAFLFSGMHFQAKGQAAIIALLFGDKVASENFNISMEIGGAFANYSEVENIERSKLSLNFGIAANWKLSDNFFLSQNIYFLARRRMEVSKFSLNTGIPELDQQFQDVSGELRVGYLDLPLLFSYQTNSRKFRFGLGPQLSLLQNATAIYNGSEGDFTQDFESNLVDLDYGVMADIAYILGKAHQGKGIHVHARYYYGLPDAIKSEYSPSTNRISFFSFHVSLPFITEELAQKNLEEY